MKNAVIALFFVPLFLSCVSAKTEDGKILKITEEENNTLLVSFPSSHPKSFSIRDPLGQWYVIEDPQADIYYIRGFNFQKASELSLDTSSLKGVVWEDGVRNVKKVFSVDGEYLLYFADNLETESENTFSLSVVYRHAQ